MIIIMKREKLQELETEYRSALETENKEYQVKEEETADLASDLKLGNYISNISQWQRN